MANRSYNDTFHTNVQYALSLIFTHKVTSLLFLIIV